MKNQESIKRLFKRDVEIHFDFSEAPSLIRRKENNTSKLFEKEEISRWMKLQNVFLHSTKSKVMYTKQQVKNDNIMYDNFFKKRGPLRGNVLDIGGGWGLYRQWWKPAESDVFVVHDPGVDRFLSGPHQLHCHYYSRAFSLPMTFVQGFGEALPYKNDVFNACLIAVTLDHCIDPQKVLKEAYRCLAPDGTILIIQSLESSSGQLHILKRLLKYFRHPKTLLAKLYSRAFYRVGHLHHFTSMNMILLLEQAGFLKIQMDVVSATRNIYAFEASKERGNRNADSLR